jgi:sterol desaturase/sphingolipid hydroxylase (fatty acid hydroxylase superfamily)
MRRTVSSVLWPSIFTACVVLNHLALTSSHPILFFNLIYLGLALSLLALERVMPHERTWLENDGQMGPDIAHTLLSKGLVQIVAASVVAMGIAQAVNPEASGIWPSQWPLALQVIIGLMIAEAGLYVAHRIAHTVPRIWRFHLIHHSVERLWIVNTGRFHFIDSFVSILLSQPLLYFAGAPKIIFLWVAAVTAFIGILTHCNVDMKSGWVNKVFNTPELHRWHHSRVRSEGDTNFGENLMFMDQIFGTYFLPSRRPPVNIGADMPVPKTFLGQLRAPFVRAAEGFADIAVAERAPRG